MHLYLYRYMYECMGNATKKLMLFLSCVCMCEFAKYDHKFLSKRNDVHHVAKRLLELTSKNEVKKNIYMTHLKLRTMTGQDNDNDNENMQYMYLYTYSEHTE